MNRTFEFELLNPPELSEEKLMEIAKIKEIKKQILILRIAALLAMLTLAIFALFIAKDSLLASVIAVVFLTVYMAGSGIISVIFIRRGLT